jgi:hypothetical protein
MRGSGNDGRSRLGPSGANPPPVVREILQRVDPDVHGALSIAIDGAGHSVADGFRFIDA